MRPNTFRIFLGLMLGMLFSGGWGSTVVYGQRQPHTFFKDHIKLTDSEIAKIEQGQIVTKVLTSGDPKYGMLVFGGVYVNAPIAKFAVVARDVMKLQGQKVYLAVQDFCRGGAPLKLSDFDRLEFERKDIDEMGSCKAGDCDIQVINLEDFQKRIDWKSADRYNQSNKLMRERLYQGMTQYLSGGLKALGSYRDRSKPLNLYQATKEMVDSSYYLPQDRAGGIYRHVTEYPAGKLAGAEDVFYWEKIDFGQEPTVRLNHVSIFPGGAGVVKLVVANKQLYASRYMRVALQLFYCVPDTANPNKPGFYLVEMNDSRLPDFGSLKLAVVRSVATGKAVEGTRDTLEIYQKRLAAP